MVRKVRTTGSPELIVVRSGRGEEREGREWGNVKECSSAAKSKNQNDILANAAALFPIN